MNKLFQEFWGESHSIATGAYPPMNLYEDNENLYLTTELPGLKENDIEINAEAQSIQIRGERKIASEGKDGHYHRRERESGAFMKKIELPTRISIERVKAGMENGVLKLILPKAEEAKPRKIVVKVG
jgi:HSP20 family protein